MASRQKIITIAVSDELEGLIAAFHHERVKTMLASDAQYIDDGSSGITFSSSVKMLLKMGLAFADKERGQ